jgi:hypothetical protein
MAGAKKNGAEKHFASVCAHFISPDPILPELSGARAA